MANAKKRSPDSFRLTPTMRAFLKRLVAEGRGDNPTEVLRGLITQEMRRWEDLHHEPFPAVFEQRPESDAVD